MLDKTPTARVETLLARFDQALQAGKIDEAVSALRGGMLLARPRRLHLEHQDHGGPGRGARHARPVASPT